MRVLLTGGAGFIGRHVLREMLGRGHEVRIIDSLRPDVHKDGKTGSLEGAELIVADVRDAAAIDRALVGVEAVLHMAAKVGLGVDVGDRRAGPCQELRPEGGLLAGHGTGDRNDDFGLGECRCGKSCGEECQNCWYDTHHYSRSLSIGVQDVSEVEEAVP